MENGHRNPMRIEGRKQSALTRFWITWSLKPQSMVLIDLSIPSSLVRLLIRFEQPWWCAGAVHGLPAGAVPGDAWTPNEPVAGGWPRRRCQQRLFLDVEPAQFGRPRVVDRRHSGPVAPVVASDVDLRDGSELVFWRSAIRPVDGSFQKFLGGGNVDRRLSLRRDQSRGSTPDQSWVVETRLKELRKLFPDPFSFLTFAGYRISLVD